MTNLSNFTQTEIENINKLIAINAEMKKLEAEKKKLSDFVKASMLNAKIDKLSVGNNTLAITESTRNTVSKALKDKFIAELVGMNKQHLVSYSIEPNLDSIFAEVNAGLLNQDFVDKYVKVTPVVTLRCN